LQSQGLIVTASENAQIKVFYVSIDTESNQAVKTLISEGSSSQVIPVAITGKSKDSLAFLVTRNSFVRPDDIWQFYQEDDRSELTQLTFLNEELLSKTNMSTPESFYFTSGNSKIQGWLFKPHNFSEDLSWPMALLIHGGPQGAWTDGWSWRWNPELWTARGYGVVLINPHGSEGFGQKFTDSVSKNWGGTPFQDIMAGVDYALETWKWFDSGKLCACGASYGGFMINWINGQTDRFACLVNHDGLFDTFGSYFTTEELWFPEWEFGLPWENPENYSKWNPRENVQNWTTPTLVIHGGKDYRLTLGEGLGTFTALQRRGIPSKFLFFPEENHWVLNPKNAIIWINTILDWLDQWTKK